MPFALEEKFPFPHTVIEFTQSFGVWEKVKWYKKNAKNNAKNFFIYSWYLINDSYFQD
jgi:hypothetical protein